jgi:hypothetical protein
LFCDFNNIYKTVFLMFNVYMLGSF